MSLVTRWVAVLGRDSHLVQPTAVTVVSCHRRACHGISIHGHQQHVVSYGELGVEHFRRRVVGRIIGEDRVPQCDDAGTVGDCGGSYDHLLGRPVSLWYSTAVRRLEPPTDPGRFTFVYDRSCPSLRVHCRLD